MDHIPARTVRHCLTGALQSLIVGAKCRNRKPCTLARWQLNEERSRYTGLITFTWEIGGINADAYEALHDHVCFLIDHLNSLRVSYQILKTSLEREHLNVREAIAGLEICIKSHLPADAIETA